MSQTRSRSSSVSSSASSILSPDDIPSLSGLYDEDELVNVPASERLFEYNEAINKRVGLFVGDLTKLSTTLIINAANPSLLGGGGVDGAIHRAAGHELLKACRRLGGCEVGDAKLTPAFRLPSTYIAHTPGPIYSPSRAAWCAERLASSYKTPLELLLGTEEGGGSVGYCCVSAGIYGYPIEDQAHTALRTIRECLEDPAFSSITKIIFCQFSKSHYRSYAKIIPVYFPGPPEDEKAAEGGVGGSGAAVVAGEEEEKKVEEGVKDGEKEVGERKVAETREVIVEKPTETAAPTTDEKEEKEENALKRSISKIDSPMAQAGKGAARVEETVEEVGGEKEEGKERKE